MRFGSKLFDDSTGERLDHIVQKYLAPCAFLGGLLIVLLATLTSFDFHFRPLTATSYFGGYQLYPSSYLDLPRNVILFMPFGFGLAALLDQVGLSKRSAILSTLLAGFLLTLLVESLQFFLPERTPTITDLLANTLGALAGLACWRLWQSRSLTAGRVRAVLINPQKLGLGLGIYLLLLMSMGFLLQHGSRLIEWQPGFPLLIGNEQTEDRPWKGSVTNLAILDKALSASEADTLFSNGEPATIFGERLVAYYPMTDSTSLYDQTGNLPDLKWKRNEDGLPVDKAPQLDGQQWLATESSIAYLAERLQTTSEFTLSLTMAAADSEQSGPARIMSISANPFLRNIMLGQEGNDLILRVRTPFTGENGTMPELIIPGVFIDEAPRHLIITFDGLAVQTFVNNSRQVNNIEMVPGIILFRMLLGPYNGQMGTLAGRIYSVLFYVLAFVPMGILLALLAARVKRKSHRYWLVIAGVCVPPLLLELILSARNGFDMRLPNILLGVAVTTIVIWLLATRGENTQHIFRPSPFSSR